MDDDGLISFHEKLYYHELDNRDKLIARLQLCLAILSLLAGVLIYLVAHFSAPEEAHFAAGAFLLVSFLLASALIVAAAWEYICALWNHHYECLPLPVAIEKYRADLIDHYKGHGDELSSAEYRKFLKTYLAECASTNAKVNEKRYEHCHNCLSYIVYSLVPIAIAGASFVLGGFMRVGP